MKTLRVMVVDDSAFSRRTITKMLEELSGVEVVGYAMDGHEGIQKIISLQPDLITLDLEMPKMDGFTLLRILTARFTIPVIVISAQSGADKVFKALELGALDFIAKPSSGASPELLKIQEDLHQKVLQVMSLKPRLPRQFAEEAHLPQRRVSSRKGKGNEAVPRPLAGVVAIGASTGGPPALQRILSSFSRQYPLAVVVSQHMPVGFTTAFAERLNRSSLFTIKEAEDGDPVLPGNVLIAPGGMNMMLEARGDGGAVIRLVPPGRSDHYIPSVDVLFESCGPLFGKRATAVILTGMGNDGARGIRAVKEHGGYVIAESEETAVVFGMPREAVATGLVDKIVPLSDVTREILAKYKLK